MTILFNPERSHVLAAKVVADALAIIEALAAQVKITGPGRIVPVFRIPQVQDRPAAAAKRPVFVQ
jgi:hypothetical protein